MFLLPINRLIFRFSPSKKFLHLLVLQLWVKNSYLIYVFIKNSNFVLERFLQYFTYLCTFSLKNTKIYLKVETKSND